MRICTQCPNIIPFHVVIDGKSRNLKNRKLCLICSPFGLHNTSKNPATKTSRGHKRQFICDTCNLPRIEAERRKTCLTCISKEKRKRNKQRAIALFGGKCSKCGYCKSINALEFHHKDPTTKSFSVSQKWDKSWVTIEAELIKCELVCANCHRESHE